MLLVHKHARKTLVEIQNPVTQTVDAVKALLAYMHRPAEPLPLFVALNDRVRLTLSKDKQAYYVTTAKGCSCPARIYNPAKPCKHMRALEVDIAKDGEESILPANMRGGFKPVDDDLLFAQTQEVA